MSDESRGVGPSNPLARLDARVALALAFWAYPYEDRVKAEKVILYPEPWEQAIAGKHLPADWPVAQFDAQGKLIRDGWNTQHNTEGKLENQFQVSINRRTKQITFDFKGSDAWSNWVSDLSNAGGSEFAKIQAKAQAAYETLKNDERYQGFQFAASGHSLGGGMAQSFALKNNVDAYVYNSLPIARETIRGDYFKDVGGFDAAMARYQASGRQVHDVRTPNDIATFYYEGVLQNQYLSRQTGQAPTMLPGPAMPDLLKSALLLSKVGTLPAAALMGKDHMLGAAVDAQQGLGIGPDGRYVVPEGRRDFAQVPVEARRRFALLSSSAVTKAAQIGTADDGHPWNRFLIERADGSRQFLSSNPRTGDVEIEHYGADGKRLRVELNERRRQGATFIEQDAQGQPVHRTQLTLHVPEAGEWQETVAAVAPSAEGPSSLTRLGAQQQVQWAQAKRELTEPLLAAGLGETQVDQVCAAVLSHCARHASLGSPDRFMLSGDQRHVGVLHNQGLHLSEMPVDEALRQGADTHLAEAARQQERWQGAGRSVLPAQEMAGAAHAHV
ncbi:hypothetical protein [Hydrogenophaga sp. NFH-34]|uniref:hypothetical protein n=1 Tax=Hydrogenophaga sp. NFH-34 TaxID=2744446 RepID=UPI001F304DB8|nr:hypothetical protein [Hydrogenophaga sp. NFH-34]